MVAEAPGCCADYVSQAATAPSGHKVTSLLTFPLKESLPRNLLRSCWVDWAGRCGWVLSARSDHQCHLQWVDGDPAIHGVPLQRLYVTRVVWHWKHIFMVHRSGSRRWKWADLVLRYSVHPGLPGAFLALALKIPRPGKSFHPWKTEMIGHPTWAIVLSITCQSWILADMDLPLWASISPLLIEQAWKAGPQTHPSSEIPYYLQGLLHLLDERIRLIAIT